MLAYNKKPKMSSFDMHGHLYLKLYLFEKRLNLKMRKIFGLPPGFVKIKVTS
jgi:hypothetical protein